MKREDVYKAIDAERDYQIQKWGDSLSNNHQIPGWLLIMKKYIQDAEQAWMEFGDRKAMEEIRKVVTVGVACAEQYGMASRIVSYTRHFESQINAMKHDTGILYYMILGDVPTIHPIAWTRSSEVILHDLKFVGMNRECTHIPEFERIS